MAKMSNRRMTKKFLISEMDQSIKQMMKLIEEEGDSFAKKAEIYYQKRPKLVAHVEEFYRMYRSLAERYENVCGELRRSVPPDLRSQGSGISDWGSEPPSTITSPEHRIGRRLSGSRPAGFDVFLRGVGGFDFGGREGDETSTLDSESDSDDSLFNNYPTHGNRRRLRKRVAELEAELRRVQEENRKGLIKSDSSEIVDYEEELRVAKEKIGRLQIELQKYESIAPQNPKFLDESKTDCEKREDRSLSDREIRPADLNSDMCLLEENSRLEEQMTRLLKENAGLKELESRCRSLEEDLKTMGIEKSEMADEIARLKAEFDEPKEVQDGLRYEENLSVRDQETRNILNSDKSLSEENLQLREQVTKLGSHVKEWESRCCYLEEDLKTIKEVKSKLEADIDDSRVERDGLVTRVAELKVELSYKDDEIDQMNRHLQELHQEHMELVSGIEKSGKSMEELRHRSRELEKKVERQQEVIKEGADEKREAIRQLRVSLEHYRRAYQMIRKDLLERKRSHSVMVSEG